MTDEVMDVATGEIVVSPVRKSQTIGKLIEALAKATYRFEDVAKDTINPFFKSKYADLAALINATRPYLAECGLVVSQFPLMDGTRAGTTTIIAHSSGEWMESDLTLPITKADAQGAGSAITYARRYAYQSVLNVAGEVDDDANMATGKKPKEVEAAEDAYLEKTGQPKAAPNLVSAFKAMFKTSGKTEAQLAAILRTRYSANDPSELTRDELGELVKWAASKEPIEETLKTSVAAVPKAQERVLDTSVSQTATQAPATSQAAPKGLVTDKQLARLFAIGKSHNVPPDDIKRYVLESYGYNDTHQLTRLQYDHVVRWTEDKQA